MGRVNVFQADGRKPRLVVDSTVCGTNGACVINESYSLPMLSSVRHSFPLKGGRNGFLTQAQTFASASAS